MKKTLLQLFFILGIILFNSTEAKAANISASRAIDGDTCVAPCSVFFEDTDGTVDSATAGEVKPFHDYHYEWDFGDAGSGNWGTSGKSRNKAKGAVAAHVFEEAGDYTVHLSVYDSRTKSLIASDQLLITILDPDEYFSGIKTICISDESSNDFVGCPVGAQNIATDDLANMPNWLTSGNRVLLRRGSSWVASSQLLNNSAVTSAQLSAYGDCSGVDANGICSNAPEVISTMPTTALFSLNYKHRLVIEDINLSASKFTSGEGSIMSGSTNLHDLLFLRLKTRGFYTSLGWYHYMSENYQTWPKNMFVVDCDVRDFHGYGLFGGAENLAVIGNQLHNSDTTHISRLWWTHKGVYSHNMVSGSSLTNDKGRAALKFHGPMSNNSPWIDDFPNKTKQVGTYAENGAGALPYSSQYAIISDNVFGSSGPWPVAIRPQDNFSDERIYDVIFERNRMAQDFGDHSVRPWQSPVVINGYYINLRNNIIDTSYSDISANGLYPFSFEAFDFMPIHAGIRLHNNTIYNKGDAFVNRVDISIASRYENASIKNNYLVFIDAIPQITISDESGGADISNNIFSDTSYFSDPDNENVLLRDFSLTSGSLVAIDKGTDVFVYDDFSGNKRTGSNDIGALGYQGDSGIDYRSDVDASGNISTADALLVLRKSLGFDMSLTGWQAGDLTGDANCDNTTNSTDALLVLRHSLGLDMGGTGWCE